MEKRKKNVCFDVDSAADKLFDISCVVSVAGSGGRTDVARHLSTPLLLAA